MYVSSGGVHRHTRKNSSGSSDPKDILQKLDLSGIEEWEPKLQQEARDLICKFACIFSQNDLDLGKMSIVKHSIKVNDSVPFKGDIDAFHLECMMK